MAVYEASANCNEEEMALRAQQAWDNDMCEAIPVSYLTPEQNEGMGWIWGCYVSTLAETLPQIRVITNPSVPITIQGECVGCVEGQLISRLIFIVSIRP